MDLKILCIYQFLCPDSATEHEHRNNGEKITRLFLSITKITDSNILHSYASLIRRTDTIRVWRRGHAVGESSPKVIQRLPAVKDWKSDDPHLTFSV